MAFHCGIIQHDLIPVAYLWPRKKADVAPLKTMPGFIVMLVMQRNPVLFVLEERHKELQFCVFLLFFLHPPLILYLSPFWKLNVNKRA